RCSCWRRSATAAPAAWCTCPTRCSCAIPPGRPRWTEAGAPRSGRVAHHDPQRIVPLPQQLGLACPGRVQVGFLDVPVAADLVRDGGDLRGEADVATVQLLQQALDGGEVVLHQLPLHASLGGAAERIECGAAQELQLRQPAERGEHPRTVLALDEAAVLVLLRQQRRRQVEVQAVVALELLLQAALEVAA